MRWSLPRIIGILVGVGIVWSLLNQFAGILFLLCAAVAGWRVWLTTSGVPRQPFRLLCRDPTASGAHGL